MPQLQLKINNPVGLHARPTALFVQTASKYVSEITLQCGGNTVNAKSILSVLTLGAGQGALITVERGGRGRRTGLEGARGACCA